VVDHNIRLLSATEISDRQIMQRYRYSWEANSRLYARACISNKHDTNRK